MNDYFYYVPYRGYELWKTEEDDLRDILEGNKSEIVDTGDEQWRPMEAFLDDEFGLSQSVEIYSRESLMTPPAEWMAMEGHKVIVTETSLTFEIKSETTPKIEDFSFCDGPDAFYKGRRMEMVDSEGIYYIEVAK